MNNFKTANSQTHYEYHVNGWFRVLVVGVVTLVFLLLVSIFG